MNWYFVTIIFIENVFYRDKNPTALKTPNSGRTNHKTEKTKNIFFYRENINNNDLNTCEVCFDNSMYPLAVFYKNKHTEKSIKMIDCKFLQWVMENSVFVRQNLTGGGVSYASVDMPIVLCN